VVQTCKRRPGGGGAADSSHDGDGLQHSTGTDAAEALKAESLRRLTPVLPAIFDALDDLVADLPEQEAWTQKAFDCLQQAKRLTPGEYRFLCDLTLRRYGQLTAAEHAELERICAKVARP
jgi:hypothetical protein